MKPLISQGVVRRFLSPFVFLLAAASAWAHDPFDFSSRMTVQDDNVEMTITVGLDAARHMLSAAGFSQEHIAETVRTRGPHSTLDLPVPVARHFFEINNDGKELTARSATVLSEGMEVIFTLIYPRPGTGTLDMRAVCYDEIKDLRQGSFVAYDERMNQLGAALLSRASVVAQVLLPPSGRKDAQAGMIAPVQLSGSLISTAGSSPPRSISAEPAKSSPQLLWLFALPVIAGGLWFAIRKSTISKRANGF